MNSIEELDKKLSEPSDRLLSDMSELNGDILILGVGGKMGPSLAFLAKRALDETGSAGKVIGVSRFSNPEFRKQLDDRGITTIRADLLDDSALSSLPDAKNVIFLVGTKFGTSGNECFTWALNSYLPGRVAEKFKNSSIVAFSTGNVYPFTEVGSDGPAEEHPPGPVGEYAQSCLGRERVFEYFSRTNNTPLLIFRLNYAIDMRYGVLLEVAESVYHGKPIDLKTGYVNVVWQGDANETALRCLKKCTVPANVLNVTGPETISVRWLAEEFGRLLNKTPEFVNTEATTALLSDSSKARKMFGPPRVSVRRMMEWTAGWVESDGETLGKPTHFQQRKGKF
ncbi:MAG: NAD(P)-dependent oxidoreductase [Balneolaceae bacterium]